MFDVMRNMWALFLGMLLLMVGNALQGSLIGVRAASEPSFTTEIFGYVSAAYFAGFLGGSQVTPYLLRRVGHVRVFAALASLVSAAFIIYAAIVDPWVWFVLRFIVGFCFSGIYIVSESWINDGSSNENRGTALSTYMFFQMFGIVVGQQLLNVGDPEGYELFVLISVLVSISFAPILLSVSPAPLYETARPMTLRQLLDASPLGSVGSFLLGAVFSAMFGMGAIYAGRSGLSVAEISIFLTVMYGGALLTQVPLGWLSDRMDRRQLIVLVALSGGIACVWAATSGTTVLGTLYGFDIYVIYPAAAVLGGLANPLYGLLIAHTNDFLEHDQMASASGGIVFFNGVGAMGGPVIVGYLMESQIGNAGFWIFIAAMMGFIGAYGIFRMTQRPTIDVADTSPFQVVTPRLTPVAAEISQEVVIEQMEEAAQDDDDEDNQSDKSEDAPFVADR
ncbi:MAG: MFS transporter [Pseudomonadota bacterium]